jgi:hypothetical protein
MFKGLANFLTKVEQDDSKYGRTARAKAKAQNNFAEKTDKVATNVAEKNSTDATVSAEK